MKENDGINYDWLTITDPTTGGQRRETARERKNRIARERRALKRKGRDTHASEPEEAVEASSTPSFDPPAPTPALPRFAWKRPNSMGYVLHQMLLAGCTRAGIRQCEQNPSHPFHGKDVWSLLAMYVSGRWNSGQHLIDPDFEGGVRETWAVATIGEEGADDEMFELRVTRKPLTDEDRRLVADGRA